jgi:signal transduction histidine kinase
MKSLRLQLVLWYLGSVVATVIFFAAITYFHLRQELRSTTWSHPHPDHPSWVINEHFTDAEVNLLTGHLIHISLLYLIPFVAVTASIGFFLAKKSIHPIACLNTQLQLLGPRNLFRRVSMAQGDHEYRELQVHINSLLERLQVAFNQLEEFSAKVAHELKTPLTLLRLKVEREADQINPDLAESLQDELKRLSDYVERMLVLARAEQGRMPVSQELFTIDSIVHELLDTYQILAHADHRSIRFHCPKDCAIEFDKQHFRQIIHNLLTNALRHGAGPILVSVRQTPRHVVLSCINAVNRNLKGSTLGVGLGLRLVRALVTPIPETNFSTTKRGNYFVARLRCPIAGAMPALRSSSL